MTPVLGTMLTKTSVLSLEDLEIGIMMSSKQLIVVLAVEEIKKDLGRE